MARLRLLEVSDAGTDGPARIADDGVPAEEILTRIDEARAGDRDWRTGATRRTPVEG